MKFIGFKRGVVEQIDVDDPIKDDGVVDRVEELGGPRLLEYKDGFVNFFCCRKLLLLLLLVDNKLDDDANLLLMTSQLFCRLGWLLLFAINNVELFYCK